VATQKSLSYAASALNELVLKSEESCNRNVLFVRNFATTTKTVAQEKSVESQVIVGKRNMSSDIIKCRSKLDITFENTEEAYKSKSNLELIRGLVVLKLCGFKFLVDRNVEILKLARKVLGKKLFELGLRATFYGHFVAGADQKEIKPVITKMREFGVKAIMDYSVEADLCEEEAQEEAQPIDDNKTDIQTENGPPIKTQLGAIPQRIERYQPQEEFWDRREGVSSARTYFYQGEPECDNNAEVILSCIDGVSEVTEGTGFVAVKLTALGRPRLLLQLSEVLAQTQQFYKVLTGSSWENLVRSKLSRADFLQRLKDMGVKTEEKWVSEWFGKADFDEDGIVDIYKWGRLITNEMKLGELFQTLNMKTGKMEPLIKTLTQEQEREFSNMIRRMRDIAERARQKNVRVMVDAEQTYFQPAISRLTLELMREYNREVPLIFNTYQCYLKNALNSVQIHMHLARRENFHFGAKIVRGAYMDQERKRAAALGYEDPICNGFDKTSEMYNSVLSSILEEWGEREAGKVSVMVATHNEDSVRFAVEEMVRRGIGPSDKVVCFGQLYGMCDQISFSLGQAGFSVYKYVPYGPVEEVLPYLSRRAVENSGLLGKVDKERGLMWRELRRRAGFSRGTSPHDEGRKEDIHQGVIHNRPA
jgi:proline dehydrogenase